MLTKYEYYMYKVPLPDEEIKKLDAEPEKLAIGCEGGFQLDKPKTKIEKAYKLVILPGKQEIAYPFIEDMPLVLTESIEAIKVTFLFYNVLICI